MSTITIDIDDVATFAKLCADLVREGVLFNARQDHNRWVITFTGAF